MKSFTVLMMFLGSATLVIAVPLTTRETSVKEPCVDHYPEKCAEYRQHEGYCDYEKDFMEKYCKKSCGFCTVPQETCRDYLVGCEKHAAIEGYCDYTKMMSTYCRKSCGFCQPRPEAGPTPERPEPGPTPERPSGPTNEFFWETTSWGPCEDGVQKRGVKCFHIYEGEKYQVDLKYCQQNLNEKMPADQRECVV